MVEKVGSNNNPSAGSGTSLLALLSSDRLAVSASVSTKPTSPTFLVAGATSKTDSAVDSANKIFSVAMPDMLVYTNSALRSRGNSKNFILLNPLTGNYTQYINHPENRVGSIGGLPLTRVEAILYNTNGTGTRREDGMGFSKSFGTGPTTSTFFFNVRGGDSNLLNNAANGISANIGFFGPPSVIRAWTDSLPSSGKGGNLKKVIQAALQAATSTGSQIGLAWRGTVLLNSKTGKLDLTLSGVTIPLADFTAGLQKAERLVALNHGNKLVARMNNEEAYTGGANPFQRADDTRTSAGRYLNHGDPVASIAGDILQLQDRLQGRSSPNLRNNSQARTVLELALSLLNSITPAEAKKYGQDAQDPAVNPRAFTAEERTKLNGLLVQLNRAGVYFDSPVIKEAAQAAGAHAGPAAGADASEQNFTRNVFQGKFRSEAVHQYNVGDGARDLLLGINRITAIVTSVFEATPVGTNSELPKDAIAARVKGFESRMGLKGGTLSALGLREPAGTTRTVYESRASLLLIRILEKKLSKHSGSEALYQKFNQLSASEVRAIARSIKAQLEKQ